MLSHIIKSAEGKGGIVTLHTLKGDMQTILPALKILLFTIILGLTAGYSRMLVLGFYPVVQGTLLALVLGTLVGKILSYGNQVPSNKIFVGMIGFGAGILFAGMYWKGISIALQNEHADFLTFAWNANDMRELPKLLKGIGLGSLLEATNRDHWLYSNIADILMFFPVLIFCSIHSAQSGAVNKRGKKSNWNAHRMLFFALAFYGSVYFTQRENLSENQRKLTTWVDETWSHQYLLTLRENTASLLSADQNEDELFALNTALEKGISMKREFPEGHFLNTLKQMADGYDYFAHDELDRAIFEAEQMTRRSWDKENRPINKDLLLAQLYQLRAKINLQSENYLAAERDLTVALFAYKDYWPDIPEFTENGFFAVQKTLLELSEIDTTFGFAACHYERYLARKTLNSDQAFEDLEEALSLGYPVPAGLHF